MSNKATSILIVEDEMLIAAEMSMDLEQLGYEVKGLIPRGEQVLAQCQSDPPDILLLDINLKGEIDGIELARRIQQDYSIPIVFLTANSDDTTFDRAKEVQPYAFLSKPYRPKLLQRTLALVVNRIRKEHPDADQQESGADSLLFSDRIFVRHKDKLVKVAIEDIFFIKADGNYSLIQAGDKEYLLTVPIKTLEQNLPSSDFMRVHRSYLVNLHKIEALTDNQENLILGDGTNVPVSRSFKPKVINRLRLF